MPKTKTSNTVKDRWNSKTYDDIRIRVKKGQKEVIQAHAERQGQSINSYVVQAVDDRMKQEDGGIVDVEESFDPSTVPMPKLKKSDMKWLEDHAAAANQEE